MKLSSFQSSEIKRLSLMAFNNNIEIVPCKDDSIIAVKYNNYRQDVVGLIIEKESRVREITVKDYEDNYKE